MGILESYGLMMNCDSRFMPVIFSASEPGH